MSVYHLPPTDSDYRAGHEDHGLKEVDPFPRSSLLTARIQHFLASYRIGGKLTADWVIRALRPSKISYGRLENTGVRHCRSMLLARSLERQYLSASNLKRYKAQLGPRPVLHCLAAELVPTQRQGLGVGLSAQVCWACGTNP